MGEIQSFTEEHAEGVARLYFRSVRGQDRASRNCQCRTDGGCRAYTARWHRVAAFFAGTVGSVGIEQREIPGIRRRQRALQIW